MDRPFPEPHPFDPDDIAAPEPRPERDPDEAMAARDDLDRLEREYEERRAYVRAAELYSRCHIEFLHNPRG